MAEVDRVREAARKTLKGHNPSPPQIERMERRLTELAQQYGEDPCWPWPLRLNKYGYGQVNYGYNQAPASRAVVIHRGTVIPSQMQVDHLCRNRACVNPAHLEVVTPAENSRRGYSNWAMNSRKTRCKHGHLFTLENTYIDPQGKRNCRTCLRKKSRDRRMRVRDEQRRAS